ncbi:Bile acid 7-alpha dehydratase [Clostridioides difficile]|nr:Bile acid 7-alpha dehydratase [Clostridioides difficile]
MGGPVHLAPTNAQNRDMTQQIELTTAERLEAIESIKRVFARRLRCLDEKEWDVYPTLHTEDVVSETWADASEDRRPSTDGVSNRVVGRDRLRDTISSLLDGDVKITTVHHAHTPEIELLSDTTARGTWAMEDHLWWHNGNVEEHLHGFGHYHEEYRKVDGEWLISYRSLSRIRVDKTPGFDER